MAFPSFRSISSGIWQILVPEPHSPEPAWRTSPPAKPPRRSSNEFQYDPRELRDGEIRLIVLYPKQDLITCDLVISNLNELPAQEYDALSYTWDYYGENDGHYYGYADSNTRPILLSGRPFLVGRNLWDALHQLSPLRGTRELWIDAICINQHNLPERDQQVRMMGRIYSEARGVLVWLGMEDFSSIRAIKCIRQMANPNQAVEFSETENLEDSLRKFTSRTYWRRLWIVQEVVLARAITLRIASIALPWSELIQACSQSRIPGLSEETAAKCIKVLQESTAARLEQVREDHKTGRTLFNLLHTCQNNSATDIRDMIYGLLGIANDSSFLMVNYTATPVALWSYLISLQTKPPRGVASFTFSGDAERTMYFAQFLWEILKLSDESLNSILSQEAEPASSGLAYEPEFNKDRQARTLNVLGEWTDTIIQLGPLGSSIMAAGRTVKKANDPGSWRDDFVMEGERHWDLGELQKICLPNPRRIRPTFYGTGSGSIPEEVIISAKDISERKPFRKKAALWTHYAEATLKKRSRVKVFRSSLTPTEDEGRWDVFRSVMTDSGRIGWTTSSARLGDLVCRFRYSDIALLLRRKDDSSTNSTVTMDIVGRIMLLRRDGEKPENRFGSRKIFQHSVFEDRESERVPVELKLSLGTLASLSRWLQPAEGEQQP